MTKCAICHTNEAIHAWQPFGPDTGTARHGLSFAALGSHYRGFPVIKVCQPCTLRIQDGERVEFTYAKQHFTMYGGEPIPDWMLAEYEAELDRWNGEAQS
jgi:hypothetical protein